MRLVRPLLKWTTLLALVALPALAVEPPVLLAPGESPPSPPSSPPPPPEGVPGPGNTGVPAGVSLTNSGGFKVTQSGAVIQNLNITGMLTVEANNVTIRNCRINANGARYGIEYWSGSGLLVEDTEIHGASSAGGLLWGGVVARRLYIHDSTDGIKGAGNFTLESSFIHNLRDPSGDSHSDGVQIRRGSNIVIRNNHIIGKIGPASPFSAGTYGTSAILLQAKDGYIGRTEVTGNLLGGGQFTFYFTNPVGQGTATPVRIQGNTWIREQWGFGPTSFSGQSWGGSNCLEWANNGFADGGSFSGPGGSRAVGTCY